MQSHVNKSYAVKYLVLVVNPLDEAVIERMHDRKNEKKNTKWREAWT